MSIPGDSIRPVDPIGNDRIRVGFRRNPTSSIKNRSDPIGLLSESFQSESDSDFVGIRWNPMKSDQIRPEFRRIPTERNPTTTLSDPINIIWIRPLMNLLGS
jgi:hypothetical protein